MTAVTFISTMLLYIAMALNLIAAAINMRGYMRQREMYRHWDKAVREYQEAKEKLQKQADEYLALIENLNKEHGESEYDDRENEYPSGADGTENS